MRLTIYDDQPFRQIGQTTTATFPVTSCECERSISTLGIVKTKLRATMGQDRLTGLCLLSRHRDIHV